MKKQKVLRRSAITLAVSTVFLLSACGGGGGGGGGSPGSPSPSYLRSVPYATPVRVGSITPINSTTVESDSSGLFSANLTNSPTGAQQLITAGRSSTTNQGSYPTYNLNVFDWVNGTLVNKTSQWMPGGINTILGTEPSVKFADFFGTGRLGMFVSPNTDNSSIVGSGWVYVNNGSSFSRIDLNLGVTGHDSAIYDFLGNGRQDIYTTGGIVSMANANGTFTNYAVADKLWTMGCSLCYAGGAGSVAIADFMGTGGSSIILTDQNNFQRGGTRLYNWSLDTVNQQFLLDPVVNLPDSRFFLPKWSGYGFVGSHEQRILAFDFDNSGLTSAVVFSQPVGPSGTWPQYSEIQFLKNKGGGVFTDVTDTTLVGYDTSTPPNYTPKLLDMNGDGLVDIVLSSTSWSSSTGAQVLIHTKENQYVASYATVLDSFVGQSVSLEKAINASATSGGNGIVFVKGPDGNMYLATAVSYVAGGVQQKAIYLSKLGATTVSAQATVANIKQLWPWMSDGQVNTVLAQSSTQFFGLNLLDPTQALNPTGELQIAVAGKGLVPIRGYLAGIDLGDGQSLLTDSVGRTYSANLKSMSVNGPNAFSLNTEHIDQYNLTSQAEYLINGNPITANGLRIGYEGRNAGNTWTGKDEGPSFLNKPTQYTVGIPEVAKYGNWSYGTQYTFLNSNPWIAFGGAWGTVNNSGVLDNVVTYRNGGFSAQASFMNVSTTITPGLITKVNNMTGTWGETGYRYTEDGFGDLGLYLGVKPVVLSGSVEAKMPTGVDNNGNVLYTNKTLAIQNQVTPYARALYTNMLNKNTMYRFSAMSTQQGQYRVMNEFRFFLD